MLLAQWFSWWQVLDLNDQDIHAGSKPALLAAGPTTRGVLLDGFRYGDFTSPRRIGFPIELHRRVPNRFTPRREYNPMHEGTRLPHFDKGTSAYYRMDARGPVPKSLQGCLHNVLDLTVLCEPEPARLAFAAEAFGRLSPEVTP